MKLDIKYKIGLLAVITAGLFSVSCIKDKDYPNPGPDEKGDDKVKLELYALPADYALPTSRAAEDYIDMAPMVIVFEGSGDTAVFTEAAQAVSNGTYSTVELSSNPNPVILLLLSNIPGNKIAGGNVELTVSDITTVLSSVGNLSLRDLEDAGFFRTIPLGTSPLGTLPFAGVNDVLPMSAVVKMPSIQEGVSIGKPGDVVKLRRAVAKATVIVDQEIVDAGFVLEAVGVANAAASGSLYYEDALSTGISGLVHYGNGTSGMAVASNNSTVDKPIYLYESAAANRTVLIAKAKVSGTTKYYRMPFYHDGGRIDILRNKHYLFKIIGVGGGFDNYNDALNHAGPDPLTYAIYIYDNYSYDIVNNNTDKIFIGVTSSAIDLYTDKEPAVTIWATTNSQNNFVITPDAGITVSTTVYSGSLYEMSITTAASLKQGQIILRAGTLTKIIPVVRYDQRMTNGVLKLPYTDCVRAERISSWLSFSSDGVNTSGTLEKDSPGPVYIHSGGAVVSGTTGQGHLVRQYSGRSSIVVEQP